METGASGFTSEIGTRSGTVTTCLGDVDLLEFTLTAKLWCLYNTYHSWTHTAVLALHHTQFAIWREEVKTRQLCQTRRLFFSRSEGTSRRGQLFGIRQLGWRLPESPQHPLISRQWWATVAGTPFSPPQDQSMPATLRLHTTCPTAPGVRCRREAVGQKKSRR